MKNNIKNFLCIIFFSSLILLSNNSFAGNGCSRQEKIPIGKKYSQISCQQCHGQHSTMNCPEIFKQFQLENAGKLKKLEKLAEEQRRIAKKQAKAMEELKRKIEELSKNN